MFYTSLFKKSDVRVTTGYSTNHRALDLSRGVVRQPIYLPTRAVSGVVRRILPGYSYGGKYYDNAPIIYVEHVDGSGSRYIHSYTKDVVVKVGDRLKAGDQICRTGNAGYSFGDHLHFEWLAKWDDLRTRVDPTPYVISDNVNIMKTGDRVEFSDTTFVRTSPATGRVTHVAVKGSVGRITDGPRSVNGLSWFDVQFGNAKGWCANVGGDRMKVTSKSATRVMTKKEFDNPPKPPKPPEPTPPTDPCKTEKDKIKGLEDTLKKVEKELHDMETSRNLAKDEAQKWKKKHEGELLYVQSLNDIITGLNGAIEELEGVLEEKQEKIKEMLGVVSKLELEKEKNRKLQEKLDMGLEMLTLGDFLRWVGIKIRG